MNKGNGFTEFNNDRGLVERLLTPFRALADVIESPGDYLNIVNPPPPPLPPQKPPAHGPSPAEWSDEWGALKGNPYSRWDLFGYHPKQHEGFMEALWEAWRLWQLDGYPPVTGQPFDTFLGYRPTVRNQANSPGRGKERWETADREKDPGLVTFDSTLKSYMTNLDDGVPRAAPFSGQFLQPGRYVGSASMLLQYVANHEFPPPSPEPNPKVKYQPNPYWPSRFWHHLMYAFCVEATNMMAIYRKIIITANDSEDLNFFHEDSQRWMRNTESLWRMTRGATDIVNDGGRRARHNAYFRMFGLDIGKLLNQDTPFDKPAAANRDFVRVFEELLYEVWNAFTNRRNTSGPDTTDPVAIREICETLHDMLTDRRLHGTLSQVEYAAVAEMSWYYLAIDGMNNQNSPIVQDMRAEATTPDERLRRLGESVGIPAHPRTRSLLKLAERVSLLLIEIEQDIYSNDDAVRRLYSGGETTEDMLEIINEWSILVDRDIKATRTAPQGRLPDAKPTPLLGS